MGERGKKGGRMEDGARVQGCGAVSVLGRVVETLGRNCNGSKNTTIKNEREMRAMAKSALQTMNE